MRPRPYSRLELHRRFRDWARANRKVLAVLAVGSVVVFVLETLLILGSGPSMWSWYLLGVLHTVVVGGFAWLVSYAFIAHDAKAIHHVRGAWGEEGTRDELRRAKRRRLVWGWIDSIKLQRGDIDHVVVTRRGGVVVIDSKWRSDPTTANRDEMTEAAKRARLRTEAIVQTVLGRQPRGRRSAGPSIRVRSVVVVWGALQDEINGVLHVDGVEFIAGRDLLAWFKSLDGDAVDARAARDLLGRVATFRDSASIGLR